ncbi:hypothetical protein HPO96_24615 [Kribbella sandramycini]|uniref:Uncharacterized protein n=1 Tax=Kribbella sandramycini TaxID=60450 RepID=A0A7Y4P188_9ACTN|nr:hypothetical protein [Kribbella sandramycini]MBB6571161.1 hypothetical protein [Kribbella sandramycini]NOL43431.1 hypothetical protein [Kribbella sandramycini]
MIDEKTLQEHLLATAAEQDDLLPRDLADDLAAGRRRLLRHRLATGAAALLTTGAVLAATLGVTGALHQAKPEEVAPAKPQQVQATTDLDTVITGLLTKHFDPGEQHLGYGLRPFKLVTRTGYRGTLREVHWGAKGDWRAGALKVGLFNSTKPDEQRCGSYYERFPKPLICKPVTLPNGRTAELGRQGGKAELRYVQPSGDIVYVAVDPSTFGDGSRMGITDAKLFAFATDPALVLPEVTSAQREAADLLTGHLPVASQIDAAALKILGGDLRPLDILRDYPGECSFRMDWLKAGVKSRIEFGVTPRPIAGTCSDLFRTPTCTKIADAELYERTTSAFGIRFTEYGATRRTPDGHRVWVLVTYTAAKRPPTGITQQQLLAVLARPELELR